jgi:hypothetical protein
MVTPLQQACGSLAANEMNYDFVTLWLLCSCIICVFSRACGFCPLPELYMYYVHVSHSYCISNSMQERLSGKSNNLSGIISYFIQPGGLLLHSQEPATCPYPEPDQSSPCPHYIFLRSILILSSHLCRGLPNDFFPSGFPTI